MAFLRSCRVAKTHIKEWDMNVYGEDNMYGADVLPMAWLGSRDIEEVY